MTGTTTVVTVADAVAVAEASTVASTVTEETAVGTGVPVAANVTAEAMDVRDATGEGDASGVGVAGDAATVAAVVMVATDVGETVGTDWLDAADGGIKATRRPATASTATARRLNMRRWGWTTDVTPSRCPKARSPHRTQQFGLGCQITTMDCMREDRALVQNQRVGTWLAQLRSLFTDRSAFVEDRSSFGTQSG